MKKTLLLVLAFVAIFASLGFGQTVLNKSNPTVAWDATPVANLPATATVSYDYGYKLSPATVPSIIGNVTGLNVTYALTTYGTYAFCVRSVLKDSGTTVSTSSWACSDVAANCLGGVTFVDSFWPIMPIPGNLTGN